MTTIYEVLKTDHVKVLGLLDKLIAAEKADKPTKEKWLTQVRDELIPHARAEEAVLYNSLRDVPGGQEIVGHAYREHLEIESVLRGLQVTDAIGINWVSGAKKLKELLSHHIKEEEQELFPAAKKLFIEEEAQAMAEVFQKMKPLIRDQSLAGTSFDMLVNMMPERLRGALGKVAPKVSAPSAAA